jgi:hypothetical protein
VQRDGDKLTVDIDPTLQKKHNKQVNLEINDQDSPEDPIGQTQDHDSMMTRVS